MSALPPDDFRSLRVSVAPSAIALAGRWEALHMQAGELAELAAISSQPVLPDLSSQLASANDGQRRLANQGIEDIDAIMQPGLTALRIIAARDQDVTAPALALWREFHAARETVLAILAEQPAKEVVDAA